MFAPHGFLSKKSGMKIPLFCRMIFFAALSVFVAITSVADRCFLIGRILTLRSRTDVIATVVMSVIAAIANEPSVVAAGILSAGAFAVLRAGDTRQCGFKTLTTVTASATSASGHSFIEPFKAGENLTVAFCMSGAGNAVAAVVIEIDGAVYGSVTESVDFFVLENGHGRINAHS